MLAEIGDQHVGALARKRQRHRAADAAIATGDDRLPAGQPTRAFVGMLAVIGDGIHLPGEARHRLLLLGERRLGIIDHWSNLIARLAGARLDGWRRSAAQTALLAVGFPERLKRVGSVAWALRSREEPLKQRWPA